MADALASALTRARTQRGLAYTYRELAEMTEALATQDPEQFLGSGKDWIKTMCERGLNVLPLDSLKRLHTVVHALYGGDMHLFARESGVYLPPLGFTAPVALPDERVVQLLEEGVPPGVDNLPVSVPYQTPQVDAYLNVNTDAMEPLIQRGQRVGLRWSDHARVGECVVLRHSNSNILKLGIWLGNEQYAAVKYPGTQAMTNMELVGVVETVKPQFNLAP